jgi:hypothetical protein
MDFLKQLWSLIRRTFSKSSEDRVSRLASSLAYYTVFCIAPLLVIAVRAGAALFGKNAAQKQLSAQLSGLIGKQAAEAVLSLVTKAYAHASGGLFATAISVVFFGYAAILLFDELQDAMNTIWDVEPGPKSSWWRTLRDQLVSCWFSLNWRPSARAERTLGSDDCVLGRHGGNAQNDRGSVGAELRFRPRDHSSHTRPVIPGELDASRARVCFTG